MLSSLKVSLLSPCSLHIQNQPALPVLTSESLISSKEQCLPAPLDMGFTSLCVNFLHKKKHCTAMGNSAVGFFRTEATPSACTQLFNTTDLCVHTDLLSCALSLAALVFQCSVRMWRAKQLILYDSAVKDG